jgi:hypothetical protein
MAVLPTLAKGVRGQAIPFQNSAAGDQVQCGPGLALVAWNSSAGPLTVTLAVPGTGDLTGIANPDNIETVAANEIRLIPLDARYADSSINGLCALTYQTPGATFKVAVVSFV